MAEIVNLRRARKSKALRAKEVVAQASRAGISGAPTFNVMGPGSRGPIGSIGTWASTSWPPCSASWARAGVAGL